MKFVKWKTRSQIDRKNSACAKERKSENERKRKEWTKDWQKKRETEKTIICIRVFVHLWFSHVFSLLQISHKNMYQNRFNWCSDSECNFRYKKKQISLTQHKETNTQKYKLNTKTNSKIKLNGISRNQIKAPDLIIGKDHFHFILWFILNAFYVCVCVDYGLLWLLFIVHVHCIFDQILIFTTHKYCIRFFYFSFNSLNSIV